MPIELRDEAFQATAETDQRNRCPGGGDLQSKDGSRPWKPTPDYNCDPPRPSRTAEMRRLLVIAVLLVAGAVAVATASAGSEEPQGAALHASSSTTRSASSRAPT